jgi:hypothetical protein
MAAFISFHLPTPVPVRQFAPKLTVRNPFSFRLLRLLGNYRLESKPEKDHDKNWQHTGN